MYCRFCGAENLDGALYCNTCGEELNMEEAKKEAVMFAEAEEAKEQKQSQEEQLRKQKQKQREEKKEQRRIHSESTYVFGDGRIEELFDLGRIRDQWKQYSWSSLKDAKIYIHAVLASLFVLLTTFLGNFLIASAYESSYSVQFNTQRVFEQARFLFGKSWFIPDNMTFEATSIFYTTFMNIHVFFLFLIPVMAIYAVLKLRRGKEDPKESVPFILLLSGITGLVSFLFLFGVDLDFSTLTDGATLKYANSSFLYVVVLSLLIAAVCHFVQESRTWRLRRGAVNEIWDLFYISRAFLRAYLLLALMVAVIVLLIAVVVMQSSGLLTLNNMLILLLLFPNIIINCALLLSGQSVHLPLANIVSWLSDHTVLHFEPVKVEMLQLTSQLSIWNLFPSVRILYGEISAFFIAAAFFLLFALFLYLFYQSMDRFQQRRTWKPCVFFILFFSLFQTVLAYLGGLLRIRSNFTDVEMLGFRMQSTVRDFLQFFSLPSEEFASGGFFYSLLGVLLTSFGIFAAVYILSLIVNRFFVKRLATEDGAGLDDAVEERAVGEYVFFDHKEYKKNLRSEEERKMAEQKANSAAAIVATAVALQKEKDATRAASKEHKVISKDIPEESLFNRKIQASDRDDGSQRQTDPKQEDPAEGSIDSVRDQASKMSPHAGSEVINEVKPQARPTGETEQQTDEPRFGFRRFASLFFEDIDEPPAEEMPKDVPTEEMQSNATLTREVQAEADQSSNSKEPQAKTAQSSKLTEPETARTDALSETEQSSEAKQAAMQPTDEPEYSEKDENKDGIFQRLGSLFVEVTEEEIEEQAVEQTMQKVAPIDAAATEAADEKSTLKQEESPSIAAQIIQKAEHKQAAEDKAQLETLQAEDQTKATVSSAHDDMESGEPFEGAPKRRRDKEEAISPLQKLTSLFVEEEIVIEEDSSDREELMPEASEQELQGGFLQKLGQTFFREVDEEEEIPSYRTTDSDDEKPSAPIAKESADSPIKETTDAADGSTAEKSADSSDTKSEKLPKRVKVRFANQEKDISAKPEKEAKKFDLKALSALFIEEEIVEVDDTEPEKKEDEKSLGSRIEEGSRKWSEFSKSRLEKSKKSLEKLQEKFLEKQDEYDDEYYYDDDDEDPKK